MIFSFDGCNRRLGQRCERQNESPGGRLQSTASQSLHCVATTTFGTRDSAIVEWIQKNTERNRPVSNTETKDYGISGSIAGRGKESTYYK
jgi:hypothetical protein